MTPLWTFFINRDKFTYLLMVALAAFGIFAVVNIAKESNPEVQIPVGVVSVALPGASAEDTESLITNEIEQGLLGELENVSSITSTSAEGFASVVVEFEADADIDASIQDLKDRVDEIESELPEEATTPTVSNIDFVDQPILTVAIAGNLSKEQFAAVANDLERELERIAGVSEANKVGIPDRQIRIIIDERALSRFNITLSDIATGISRANTTLPAGNIETNNVTYTISFEGDITSPAEIADIPISSRNGVPVFVRDVAEVVDGFEEATTLSRLSVDGNPSQEAVLFEVKKQTGGDITRITELINERLVALQEEGELLDNLTVTTILDSGTEIKKELGRLVASGLQTVVLVVLVLIITLGWREGLIAGVAIPLSFFIGFIGLYASGNTINFVSLFALVLAVGILVDSAVVMVEGIHRRMKENKEGEKRDAASLTIRDFNIPLTTGTLTTVAMFSGLFLIGGVSGQFISAIPFTINFVLLASLLVALGFIPLIAMKFLRRRDTSRLEELQERYTKRAENWYREKLGSILGNKKRERQFLTLIILGFIIALVLPFTGVVKVIFFDQEDIDWIFVELELPQGTTKDISDRQARIAEEILYEEEAINSFTTTVGASSAFSNNSGGSADEKFASFLITLDENREYTSTEVVERLRERFVVMDDIEVRVGQPNNGPPTGTPIVVQFLGEDLEELSRIALEASNVLAEIPHTIDVETSAGNNTAEFVFELDKAKAAALGLDPFTISSILRDTVFGIEATKIQSDGEDIDVFVQLALNEEYRTPGELRITTAEEIEQTNISLPGGGSVPLGSLVTTRIETSRPAITHEDGKRIATVSANVDTQGNVIEITNAFSEQLAQNVFIPADVEVQLGGENEESQEAFVDMFFSLIVGVVLMFGILMLQFNSYRHALYVLSILPFSLIGIMAGLALTQKALSFPSLMGFVALSGIVVNNSILLIDQMNANRKKNPYRPTKESVIDAAVSRLRPILLTTATTVIGIFPLTFASDLWSPLAYAVMFGLSFSVIITLLLVPIIYTRKPGDIT